LTDVILPGKSGRVLGDALKASRPDMRVLYVPGYTDDLLTNNGVLNCETALLHKPFSIESLLTKVRDVLSTDSAE
jgi:FixJ family two-component response regulator